MKPRPKFCEQCGRELPLEGKFCPGCGDLIESSTTPSTEEIPSDSIPKPPYTGGNNPNIPPPVSPQQTIKAPFGVSPGYKTVTPGGIPPIPTPTPSPYAGKTPFAGGKLVREKRMGGGIPTILGGLAFIGFPVYAIVNKITSTLAIPFVIGVVVVPIVGVVALIIGVFMLKVRSWKTFALTFLGSMALAAYSGYSLYQLVQITESAGENVPVLLQSGLVFVVVGSVFTLFGFSRAFNSLFRR